MIDDSPVTEAELDILQDLYHHEGAWTPLEAHSRLTRLHLILERGLLVEVHTAIGPLFQLSPEGRMALFGDRHGATSLTRQQDKAYRRLCIEFYNWKVATDAVAEDIQGLAGQRLLIPVRTPEGLALVGAQMTAGGYRPLAIKELGDRLRSSALHRGFRVILFTPRPTLGQPAAKKYASFLKLIPLVPTNATATYRGVPTRVQVVPNDAPQDANAGSSMLHPMRTETGTLVTVPPCSRDILVLPRAERVARFRSDLQMDKVIAETQLHRHYGLKHEDLTGVPFVESLLRPMHANSNLEIHTRLYLAARGLGSKNDVGLMHLVGVGEMRRMLGVIDPAQWVVSTAGRHRTEEPDAVWKRGWQTVAIEYDSGHYKLTLVLRKLAGFQDRGMHETVWGVPSARRAKYLVENTYGRMTQVPLVTEWWLPLSAPRKPRTPS